MKKSWNSIKIKRKIPILLILLALISAIIILGVINLESQSLENASYSEKKPAVRSRILNIYDTAKGVLLYKKISNRFNVYPKYSTEKLKAMVSWVYENIRPQYAAPVRTINDNFYNVVIRGFGYCDNDAQAFDMIAFLQGYKVHSLALRNPKTGISPHTLNEILWNNKWVVVDPWMNIVFQKNGDLLSKEDIIKDDYILRKYNYPKEITGELFKDSFLLKPFPLISLGDILNKFKENDEKVATINLIATEKLEENTELEEDIIIDAKIQHKIFTQYRKARTLDLSGEYGKAYEQYSSIKNLTLLKDLEETVDYQKAVALYNKGDYETSKKLLKDFLNKYSKSLWKPSVNYFLDLIKNKS